MDTLIGFDSAWTDNKKAPGAICALTFDDSRPIAFHPPRLSTFDEALAFIDMVKSEQGATLIALDQPTVVPNLTSMRPVEKVAASVISWIGGGVQPSNRGKVGMFCDASPIWAFLSNLGAIEDPELARTATSGTHVMEVFPALALPSFDPQFFSRLGGPRYNPGRKKTFRLEDWRRVARAAEMQFLSFDVPEAAEWCAIEAERDKPTKADQDRLDAMLCLLVAMLWRLGDRDGCMMLGDLETGYMITPASPDVRERIKEAAIKVMISVY